MLQTSAYNRGLLATTWLVTSLSTIAIGARLYTRYWRFSKFYWDDFFVVLAWILCIPMAAQVTVAFHHDTALASHAFFANAFLSRPITQLFFYNSLWAVKISFLIFFRRIGVIALPRVKRYWLVVFCVTFAAYIGAWLLNPYDCWVKKGLALCDRDSGVAKFTPIALSFAAAFDIVTDGLILAIPFAILSHMQLSLRQKVVLYSIFSIEIITISVAFIRVAIAAHGFAKEQKMFQISLLLFLSHIEASTAVIVACAGTLRGLFTQKEERPAAALPWDPRPPSDRIVSEQRASAPYRSNRSAAKSCSEEESITLTSVDRTSRPSKPFEKGMPIDLGELLKKPDSQH